MILENWDFFFFVISRLNRLLPISTIFNPRHSHFWTINNLCTCFSLIQPFSLHQKTHKGRVFKYNTMWCGNHSKFKFAMKNDSFVLHVGLLKADNKYVLWKCGNFGHLFKCSQISTQPFTRPSIFFLFLFSYLLSSKVFILVTQLLTMHCGIQMLLLCKSLASNLLVIYKM